MLFRVIKCPVSNVFLFTIAPPWLWGKFFLPKRPEGGGAGYSSKKCAQTGPSLLLAVYGSNKFRLLRLCGLGSQPDNISANAASIIQWQDLNQSGLLCNEEKSHWASMQIREWLGFVINTISMQLFLPQKKVEKLKLVPTTVISDGYCSYQFLAKIAGSVLSCALAVGPVSRLLTRQMYFTTETRSAWDSIVHFTPAFLEELRFWYTNIDCFNGYRLRSVPSCCTVLFSDASQI